MDHPVMQSTVVFSKHAKTNPKFLNRQEFPQFIEDACDKHCPPQMYDTLCTYFSCDPAIGINFQNAFTIMQQAKKQSKDDKSLFFPTCLQSSNPNTIKQALFMTCDSNSNGTLTQKEFHKFVQLAFKNPALTKLMYENICNRFNKDMENGLDWHCIATFWKHSIEGVRPGENEPNLNELKCRLAAMEKMTQSLEIEAAEMREKLDEAQARIDRQRLSLSDASDALNVCFDVPKICKKKKRNRVGKTVKKMCFWRKSV